MRYLSSLALVALLTILSYCAAASVAHGQTAGDYYFLKWDGTKFVEVYRSPNSTDLIGYDGAGNLANIPRNTFAPLSHTQAWSTITATPTTLSGYGITDAITAAAVAAAYQPLDSDLTSIAALTTTTFGRDLLALADATALRGLATSASGSVVKIVRANYTSTASGTTTCGVYGSTSLLAMTQGDQYMTITYTPTSATNRLYIRAYINLGSSVNAHAGVVLARSGDTNARAQAQSISGATMSRTDYVYPCQVELDEATGGTSAITYNVRAGGHTPGTFYLNRSHAGVYPVGLLSYIEITEYVP